GTIQIQATATGYSPAYPMVVQVTRPKFVMSTATELNTTSPAQGITIYAADVNGQAHYTTEDVTVTLASSAPSVASIDSATITIPAGMYYVSTAKWSPGVTGTAQLSASDARAAYYQYDRGTVNVAVVTPSLTFSWGSQPLGIGQYIDEYVSTPDNTAAPIDVAFSHICPARTKTDNVGAARTVVTQETIPANPCYVQFYVKGLTAGTCSSTFTAPNYQPSSIYAVTIRWLPSRACFRGSCASHSRCRLSAPVPPPRPQL